MFKIQSVEAVLRVRRGPDYEATRLDAAEQAGENLASPRTRTSPQRSMTQRARPSTS